MTNSLWQLQLLASVYSKMKVEDTRPSA